MPAPRSLLSAVISTISCAALVAGSAAPAAASQSGAPPARVTVAAHGHARAADRAHAGCAKSSAHAARRVHPPAHACRSSARGLRIRDTAKSRPTKSRPRTARSAPVPGSAPSSASAQQSSTDELAATIAAVLATPCQNTELTPEADDIGLVRAAVLCLINRKRAENGESPLISSPQLEQAAEGHCQELVADDYFAHVSPSGETPVDRIRTTGYIPSPGVGYVIGENLAWGTYQLSTPQAIVSAWFASPGHLANILEAQYRETGIGITSAVPASLAAGAPGATYAQEFGVIIQ